MTFDDVVVFILGYVFLFKSALGRCEVLRKKNVLNKYLVEVCNLMIIYLRCIKIDQIV